MINYVMTDETLTEWLDGLQKPPEFVYPNRITVIGGVANCGLSDEEVGRCGKLNYMKEGQVNVCAVSKDGSQDLPVKVEKMAICGMCMRR